MGDMADDWNFAKEQRKKHRAEVEPKRMEYALAKLYEAGFVADVLDDQTLMVEGVKFWPFTGWFSGKGVGSGRGINNLVKALKK